MNQTNTGYQVTNSLEDVDGKRISIEEILQTILRRKIGILLIILLTIGGTIMYHLAQTPEYYAVSVMMINQQDSPDLVDAVLGGGSAADSKWAQKDVELLQSKPIAEMVVRELWNSGHRDSMEFFGKRPYISPISQLYRWIVPIAPSSYELGAIPKDTPLYDAWVRYFALKLNERIKVGSSRQTGVLNVSVASPFPDEAVLLTNTLCDVYKKSDIQRKSEKYVQSNRYVAEMLKEQKQLLFDADATLSKFMTQNKIYEVTGNTAGLLTRLVELDSRYNDTIAEYNITLNNRNFLEKKLTDADRDISKRISNNVNALLGTMQEEMRSKESDYMRMLRDKNTDDPDVKSRKQELDQIKARYEQISRSKIAGQIGYLGQTKKYSFDLISEKLQLDRKLNQLDFSGQEYMRLKNYYEGQLGRLPEKEQSFVRLQRDRDVVSKTYLFLKEKLDETRILIGSEVGGVSIIGSAFKPFLPESPDLKKTFFIGIALAVILSALYVISAEAIDDRIIDEVSFFKSLGLSIWGVIPFLSSFQQRSKNDNLQNLKEKIFNTFGIKKSENLKKEESQVEQKILEARCPLMTDKLNSIFAESFRTLRTNLGFHTIDRPLKSILISGCTIGEGKSTICTNLAISWAISDKKTLIIDADLRRPIQHIILEMKRTPGLTDCLVGDEEENLEQYLQKTHIDNLFLLSSGSLVPNPNEILGSQKMRLLLKKLDSLFDKIVIDSPPIFISDAAQLVNDVDGVLIAARLNYSSRSILKEYANDNYLHKCIIGVALIDKQRPTQDMFFSGKYGYGKYGYGSYGSSYPDKY